MKAVALELPTPAERPWLTVDEVAAITGEGSKAIRSAIDAGQIPSLRIGRYVRIPTAAFRQLVGIDTEDSTTAEAATSTAAGNRHPAPCNDVEGVA